MFRLDHKATFEAVSPDGDESDDNISLTSTVSGHDPEQEFCVEGILAEHQFEDGNMYYLVEWTGFQLHESTWESESNLGGDLKAMWEEDKAKHATGELEPFDVEKFFAARDKAKKEKRERHRRRNLKRERLGLSLTAPFADEDSSDEEAVEETGTEESASDAAPVLSPPSQQNVSKGVPDTSQPTSALGNVQQRNEINRRPSTEDERLRTEAPSSTKRKQTTPSQTTGYPGTARKPSKTATDVIPKSKARPAVSVPVTTVPSAAPAPRAQKPLTARKSAFQPTGNIFTSGKIIKQRASLKDVMSDSTKTPKLFDRHRYRRLAQLGSRGKEDIAPDASKVQLFDLRSGQVVNRRNLEGFVSSPTQLSPQNEIALPIDPLQAFPVTRPDSTVVNTDAAPPKKKRKSVRFLEDEEGQSVLVQEPEQMDLDWPVSHGPCRTFRSPPPGQTPGLDQDHWTPPLQGVQSSDKKLIFNQSSITATFHGLPREPPSLRTWLSVFLGKESLEFRYTCFAKTAASKIGTLIQEPLASGAITSTEDEASLEQVAEYLATGLLALYHGETEFNIVVYPTKCNEWKSILPGREPASPSGAALGFLIFASLQDCQLMLPPLIPQPDSELELKDRNTKSKNENTSSRELMFKQLFGFDYNKLLPASSRPHSEHSFFLAMPNSRREIGQVLYHWLRACDPACMIFTSYHAGGWDAFRARVEYMPGVVIIHETLAWSMRRFPHLSRYLITKNDEYWCISEPVHGPTLYPSISILEYPVPPADMHLTRLFPYSTAIFLTPSFLVSEPRRSLEFFEWYTRKWTGNFHYRLVTAYNIHEYLSELAEERYQARQDLWNSHANIQVDMEANLSGLSREDCRCRYATAELAADMHIARAVKAGPFAHDEGNSSLVYADPSIDPNDEQSLINWFGWWTVLRADQFRKFHVIGSSQTIKIHGCRRGERRVRIPKYSRVTLNNPDAVLEVLLESNDQVEASETDANGGGRGPEGSNESRWTGFQQGHWAFRSNLIRLEDPNAFAVFFDKLCQLDGFRVQWVLYRFPVCWLDLQMAEHFGDFTVKFPRISDWFKFTHPFGACFKNAGSTSKPAFGYNTYIGFFYTIDKEWDPENPPPEQPVERHPWIAIYRPVNPHRRPYGRCELIIWDPAARARYPSGQAPAEKDLIFMQRQLIQYVRDNTDGKNQGTWLDQVWFGGWDWPADCDSQYPIDVALLFLQRMLGDIRGFMPAPERVMESKGYRRVRPHSSSPSPVHTARSPTAARKPDDSSLFIDQNTPIPEGVPMDIDPPSPPSQDPDELASSSDEEDEDTRIIFHPPRGHNTTNHNNSKQPMSFQSKCVNRLYEEAWLAKARGARSAAAPTHMEYRFPPTMDWYNEQMAEGRGYAHINVDSWEKVFNLLKIGKGAKVSEGQNTAIAAGAGLGHADGKRRESVGSGNGSRRESVGSERRRESIELGRRKESVGSWNGNRRESFGSG